MGRCQRTCSSLRLYLVFLLLMQWVVLGSGYVAGSSVRLAPLPQPFAAPPSPEAPLLSRLIAPPRCRRAARTRSCTTSSSRTQTSPMRLADCRLWPSTPRWASGGSWRGWGWGREEAACAFQKYEIVPFRWGWRGVGSGSATLASSRPLQGVDLVRWVTVEREGRGVGCGKGVGGGGGRRLDQSRCVFVRPSPPPPPIPGGGCHFPRTGSCPHPCLIFCIV
jgi:hypothetical protein